MEPNTAHSFADAWIRAWNRHDLEAILEHYAEEIEFVSPFVLRIKGEPSGIIRGKAELRSYVARALEFYPGLHFKLHETYVGVNSLVIRYTSVNNIEASEVFEFNHEGHVARVMAHYT